MRQELIDLRKKMKAHGFDAYLIPTSDFHGSEYVHDFFKCREFVSGFTGSAGTLVVTMSDACPALCSSSVTTESKLAVLPFFLGLPNIMQYFMFLSLNAVCRHVFLLEFHTAYHYLTFLKMIPYILNYTS